MLIVEVCGYHDSLIIVIPIPFFWGGGGGLGDTCFMHIMFLSDKQRYHIISISIFFFFWGGGGGGGVFNIALDGITNFILLISLENPYLYTFMMLLRFLCFQTVWQRRRCAVTALQ